MKTERKGRTANSILNCGQTVLSETLVFLSLVQARASMLSKPALSKAGGRQL